MDVQEYLLAAALAILVSMTIYVVVRWHLAPAALYAIVFTGAFCIVAGFFLGIWTMYQTQWVCARESPHRR